MSRRTVPSWALDFQRRAGWRAVSRSMVYCADADTNALRSALGARHPLQRRQGHSVLASYFVPACFAFVMPAHLNSLMTTAMRVPGRAQPPQLAGIVADCRILVAAAHRENPIADLPAGGLAESR